VLLCLVQTKDSLVDVVWTGIGVDGVVMTEKRRDRLVVTQRHAWQDTHKISYKRKRFSIKPKPVSGATGGGATGALAKFNYYTDSYKKFVNYNLVKTSFLFNSLARVA